MSSEASPGSADGNAASPAVSTRPASLTDAAFLLDWKMLCPAWPNRSTHVEFHTSAVPTAIAIGNGSPIGSIPDGASADAGHIHREVAPFSGRADAVTRSMDLLRIWFSGSSRIG
jgi:hypothetical protein